MWVIKKLFGRPNTENNKWLENPEMLDQALERNDKARRFEKKGLTAAAIPLYKESVEKQFCYELPYSRLYRIYMSLHRYEDALWVCETYINNPYRLTGGLRHWKLLRWSLQQRVGK